MQQIIDALDHKIRVLEATLQRLHGVRSHLAAIKPLLAEFGSEQPQLVPQVTSRPSDVSQSVDVLPCVDPPAAPMPLAQAGNGQPDEPLSPPALDLPGALLKALSDLAPNSVVSTEKLMRKANLKSLPMFFSALKGLRAVLRQQGKDVENVRGIGYRLVQHKVG